MIKQHTILCVDDEPIVHDIIGGFLFDDDYRLVFADNGLKALDLLQHMNPDVILLDVMMPELSGFELCQQLKANDRWRHIPVILVTALDSKQDLARGLDSGADDFINKPVNGLELRARVRSMLRIKDQYDALQHNSSHDSLTDLPNRTFFYEQLAQTIARAEHGDDHSFAVLFVDLDRFKSINDTLGHAMGDALLVEVSRRLEKCVRPHDTVARFGGDEFTILLAKINQLEDAVLVADRVRAELEKPIELGDQQIIITTSIGIADSSQAYEKAEDLIRFADTAMYEAKSAGRDAHKVFKESMQSQTLANLNLKTASQHAADRQDFQVYYQPLYSLDKQHVAGAEALMRWQHPTLGLLTTTEFISIADEDNLIVPLSSWILQDACIQTKGWHEAGHTSLRMIFKLSANQLRQKDLPKLIQAALEQTGLPPHALEIELSRGITAVDAGFDSANIQLLKDLGLQIAIDSFDLYTALGTKQDFPIDTVKIDKTFISNLTQNQNAATIVTSLIDLSHRLDLKVVAKGVETDRQITFLRDQACDEGQGSYYGPLMAASELTELLGKIPAEPT